MLAQAVPPMPTLSTSAGIPPMAGGVTAPFLAPQFPMFPPYMIPSPPPVPPSLDQLTVEELNVIEGNEREHVQARIKVKHIYC